MTDVELRDKSTEWIRSQGWSEENLPNDEYVQMCDAYIAGAKENGVIWHDLRKSPNDLPQKVGDYIVAIKFKYLKGCDTTILRYDEDEDEDKLSWIDSEYTNCNDDVIAWCELPKFEVVE